MLALFALALLIRVAIPAGWMPDASGGAIRITLCSGEGAVAAWIGKDGNIHKEDPSENDRTDAPCAFGGMSFAEVLPVYPLPAAIEPVDVSRISTAFPRAISAGRGLAAPPPPKTGPPTLI